MSRFFSNAKRSLDSLLSLISDLVKDGLLFFRLLSSCFGNGSHKLAGHEFLRTSRKLIVQMAQENPTWGQARVAAELSLKLGIGVSQRTVRAY
jgi:hypothetical protein